MAKYRKLPIVIEAYQTDKVMYIDTLEGTMKADIGDWIITGIDGEQYPCKPDIFEKTYEPYNPENDYIDTEFLLITSKLMAVTGRTTMLVALENQRLREKIAEYEEILNSREEPVLHPRDGYVVYDFCSKCRMATPHYLSEDGDRSYCSICHMNEVNK